VPAGVHAESGEARDSPVLQRIRFALDARNGRTPRVGDNRQRHDETCPFRNDSARRDFVILMKRL
jgi:hypothetical protein